MGTIEFTLPPQANLSLTFAGFNPQLSVSCWLNFLLKKKPTKLKGAVFSPENLKWITQDHGSEKGGSFLNMAIFGIYVKFLGVIPK